MSEYDNNITFNGVRLMVKSLTPIRRQKTVKQIMGKSLSQSTVLGITDQQWTLQINGVIIGTTSQNISDNRTAIEALDSDTPYAYVDGIHNGTYIMTPGTLAIRDSGENVESLYPYTVTLVEQ